MTNSRTTSIFSSKTTQVLSRSVHKKWCKKWPPFDFKDLCILCLLTTFRLYVRKCHVVGSTLREITSGEEQKRFFVFYLQVSCPEGLISRWGFRQIYRQEMRQQWRDRKYSSHCQSICNRKLSCQTFFTALDVLQLFTLGQHLQTTKSILYEKLWHPMFSRLFCFDVWFWFNASQNLLENWVSKQSFFVLILTTAKKIFFLGIKLFCFSR